MKKERGGMTDRTLALLVVLLAAAGLALLYSTSMYNGRVRFQDPAYYFKKQLFATALGFLVCYMVSHMDYHVMIRFAPSLYGISLLLSVAVLLFGDAYNGSRRWLSLGPLSFQPSEFAKVAVILLLAWNINRCQSGMDSLIFMIKTMALVLPVVGLVGTNNLSTAVIILGIAVILIFVASPGYRKFIGMGAAGIGFLAIFLSMESYRLERLAVWRNPEEHEKGFQTIQGLYAIGSGGIFGRGLGSSLQKLGLVPEAQNDMIFSIVCEELGIFGAVMLLLLFCYLLYRLFFIAQNAPDLYGSLMVTGIFAHIALQVILNICVVINVIPTTGITLPFVSYGGTSVLFLMVEMGIALSVSRKIKFQDKIEG